MSSRYPPPDPEYDEFEAEDDSIRISRRAALAGAAGLVATAAAAVALFIVLRDDDDDDDGAAIATATDEPTEVPTEPEQPTEPPEEPTATPEPEEPTPEPEPSPTEEPTATPEPTPTEAEPTETPTPEPTATEPAPTPTPIPPPEPGWTLLEPTGEPPAARRDHSLAADRTGERVYLFGGRADGQELQDLWVYDVPDNRWIQVEPGGDPPPARFGHNAIFDEQQQLVMIFGGQAGSDFFNDVWIYDPVANAWAMADDGEGADTPLTRYGAGAAPLAGSGGLFVSHGFTSSGRFDDTWLYDLQSGQWTDVSPDSGPRPVARCLIRMAGDPDRDRLLLFGGQSNTAAYLGDTWAFDTDPGEWEELDIDDNPPARNLYSLVRNAESGDLILFGGASAGGFLSDVWVFEVDDDEWEERDDDGPVPARDSHDAAWLERMGAMVIFGGRGAAGMLNDLWLYVPE